MFIFSFIIMRFTIQWILSKTKGTVKEDFEMFDKVKIKNAKKVVTTSQKEDPIHILALDDGEFAFMEWLNSENKTSSKNHIVLQRYEKDKECFLRCFFSRK